MQDASRAEASWHSAGHQKNYDRDLQEAYHYVQGMMKSLLYISKSSLTLPVDEVEIGCIVAAGRSRNASLGVTGALIATHDAFAQILEGEENAIDELMHSITFDSRHTDLKICEYKYISQRRFQGWGLAYSGPASYIGHRLAPLFSADSGPLQIAQLVRLMEEFGRQMRPRVQ